MWTKKPVSGQQSPEVTSWGSIETIFLGIREFHPVNPAMRSSVSDTNCVKMVSIETSSCQALTPSV